MDVRHPHRVEGPVLPAHESGIALVRQSGEDELVVSAHRSMESAEAALRKPEGRLAGNYRVVAFGPGTGMEMIERYGMPPQGRWIIRAVESSPEARRANPTHDEMTAKEFDAALRSGPYAWPGGYPLFFYTADGGALSFETAWVERDQIFAAIRDDDRNGGWRVMGVEVNWEDPELLDSHTGDRIESAYAEDDAQDHPVHQGTKNVHAAYLKWLRRDQEGKLLPGRGRRPSPAQRRGNPVSGRFTVYAALPSWGHWADDSKRTLTREGAFDDFDSARRFAQAQVDEGSGYVIITDAHLNDPDNDVVWRSTGAAGHHRRGNPTRLSFDQIRAGDRVTYVDPRGQEHTGKVVMRGDYGWVLNLGGRHGTPGLVDEGNFVRATRTESSGKAGLSWRDNASDRED